MTDHTKHRIIGGALYTLLYKVHGSKYLKINDIVPARRKIYKVMKRDHGSEGSLTATATLPCSPTLFLAHAVASTESNGKFC